MGLKACLKFIEDFVREIPEEHLFTSATLVLFNDSPKLAAEILLFLDKHLKSRTNLLDLGCGYGYLTVLFKNILIFENAYGVDIDNERLHIAEKRGVITCQLDLERDPLPFPSNHFDLVMATGIP